MDNPSGAVDVPLSLFGGMTLELSPPDIPEGLSPDCQDVVFLPGSVGSRPGMHRRIVPNSFLGNVVYEKTYLSPLGPLNLYLDDIGGLWKEDVTNSPGTVTQIGLQVAPHSFATSVTAFGREYFAFSDGVHGSDYPLQYDGVHLDPVTQYGPGAPCSAAISATGGNITPGVHLFVVMFQTRNGYITKPSPFGTWTSAGAFRVDITNLPIGPPDVIARIVAFTGAGGANFFYIPTIPTVSGVVVGTSTVVMNNTSTTASFDFSDNTLFNSTAIDVPGNNLFQMERLPLSLGVFAYSQRLMYFGMDNVVTNLLNMDFNGGWIASNVPTGWTVVTAGGALVPSTLLGTFVWEVTGTGAANIGQITQPAYQDQNGVAIIQPSTKYTFKMRGLTGTPTGNVVAELYSAGSGGVLATATIPVSTFFVNGFRAIGSADFSAVTPAVIPADLVLRVRTDNIPNTLILAMYNFEIVYTSDPYINDRAIMSYVEAPEQFDGLTGQIGAAIDPTPITCCAVLRDTLRLKTTGGIHTTQDNGTTEPSGWTISEFSRTVGVISTRAGDPGMFGSGDTAEDWDLTASRGGLYLDFAGDLFKVSQEIQPLWDSIFWPAAKTIWIKNDPVTRRIYIGLPIGETMLPNKIAVMDYRELDAAFQISTASPVHISFTGKMISSDLTRKWTVWNIASPCGEILTTANSGREFCIGFGNNSYYLDSAKLTDDDLGQIYPHYTTYAFLNHEAEVALGTGVHRKLYRYLTMFASGVGLLTVTPYVDSLTNAWTAGPAFTLQSAPSYDIEWGLNVTGERCFFKIASAPATGTDNSFKINKLVASIQAEPWAPVRGAW